MSFLKSLMNRVVPVVHADEEDNNEEEAVADPQTKLRTQCGTTSKCAPLQEKLNSCNDRVNSRSQTEENCFEELIDLVECVDHCVAKTLFMHLK